MLMTPINEKQIARKDTKDSFLKYDTLWYSLQVLSDFKCLMVKYQIISSPPPAKCWYNHLGHKKCLQTWESLHVWGIINENTLKIKFPFPWGPMRLCSHVYQGPQFHLVSVTYAWSSFYEPKHVAKNSVKTDFL